MTGEYSRRTTSCRRNDQPASLLESIETHAEGPNNLIIYVDKRYSIEYSNQFEAEKVSVTLCERHNDSL